MSKTHLVIEILGEGAFHKFLNQSGWSGKDYIFHYNRHTNSHIRAYHDLEEYKAERVDMHKSANVWPLMANLLPEEQIEAHAFTSQPPVASVTPMQSEPAEPGGSSEAVETRGVEVAESDSPSAHTPNGEGTAESPAPPEKRKPGRPPKAHPPSLRNN